LCEAANDLKEKDVNEWEEKEEQLQLPSWNRRGGPKGRGGSKVEILRSLYHPVAARHPSCSRRGVKK